MNGFTEGTTLYPVVHEIEVPPPVIVTGVQSIPSILTETEPLNPVPVIVTD